MTGPISSILVASDLSPESDRVVAAAAELAEETGADLHVLHALDLVGRSPKGEPELAALGAAADVARSRLAEQLHRVRPTGVAAGSLKLDYRAPGRAIPQRALEVDADLIVVGPHRGEDRQSHRLGSTAQRVVEEAVVPCLVTRTPIRPSVRRILLPVSADDVREGQVASAVAWLDAMMRARDAESSWITDVRVVHVARDLATWGELSHELSRQLREIDRQRRAPSRLEVSSDVALSRSAPQEIVRIAEELEVDFIAMGSRGHGPLLRRLLGSVSAAVLQEATTPVLLFPPRFSHLARGRKQADAARRGASALTEPALTAPAAES